MFMRVFAKYISIRPTECKNIIYREEKNHMKISKILVSYPSYAYQYVQYKKI